MLVLYVASFGPACWWMGNRSERLVVISRIYGPIGWTAVHAWTPIRLLIRWYARAGLAPNLRIAVPTDVYEYGGNLII